MIPLKDNIPSFHPPYVNYALIASNILAFFLELATGPQLQSFIIAYGFVPGRFIEQLWRLPPDLPLVVAPLVTSVFLHGGWLHLLGNMWFLYVFGDNVEDLLGHGRYLLFFILSGVGANLIYLIFSPSSMVPLVGASGAVAGVMGAYFNLFPGARVLTLVPFFFFPILQELPAYIFLGFWFLMQFFMGISVGMGAKAGGGGVAWWAHVGGFLVGLLLLQVFAPGLGRITFRRRRS